MDQFGIKMLYPSTLTNPRDWFCNWDQGVERKFGFGSVGSTDPELMFRGNGTYTIYGSDHPLKGQMKVIGSCPRIYVRGSPKETDVLPNGIPKWGNVEVTFYALTSHSGSNVSYAGIESCVRTNHCPDSLICSTRGYGCKLNFDGRCQFEKETGHGKGEKQTSNVYPFGQGNRMPLNVWIGMKFVCRSCDHGTKVNMECYLDMTDGLNGGQWVKWHDFTDYDGWSSDTNSCCATHKGKVLLPPYMTSNYSVYLRTDGLINGGTQFYKKFSIREIDPIDPSILSIPVVSQNDVKNKVLIELNSLKVKLDEVIQSIQLI